MFLKLSHTFLDVYNVSRDLVYCSYKVTNKFPPSERFGLITQIRRAALSVHLNIAEGCSRNSSNERKRFFEISRGSLVEVDTAFDISIQLNFIEEEELKDLEIIINRCFQLLSKMIKTI
jgi:four helix bundle protein